MQDAVYRVDNTPRWSILHVAKFDLCPREAQVSGRHFEPLAAYIRSLTALMPL